MVSLVEAFLMLSYTGMVYVLSCRGFLVCYHTQGRCIFSPVEAFLTLPYTRMVYVLPFRGFLVVIVHKNGVCSLL